MGNGAPSRSSVSPFFRSSVSWSLRSSVPPFLRPLRGLTLVELMVASSILAIGLVLVGRGLLTASTALDSAEDRLEAIRFLDAKLAELRQQAQGDGGVEAGGRSGTIELNHRHAAWALEIVPVEPEALSAHGVVSGQEAAASETSTAAGTVIGARPTTPEVTTAASADKAEGSRPGAETRPIRLAKVRVTLSWQEGPRVQDAELATYLDYKSPSAAKDER